MDKGAHFYCVDFQVHSPRDRQWQGVRPTTEEARREYARRFLAACRQKGLSAVAITDHHDLGFVHIIREEARSERDDAGNSLAGNQRISVFPGMELTLGVPCQALLIFDADFPTDLFPLVLGALAITPAPDSEDRTAETRRLGDIVSLRMLYDLLDRHEYLKGRYIVLPNVSESGSSTLLRTGHAGHYKDMPSVGGYVDGSIDQFGEGNRRITQGKNSEYGNKKIAVFQTSDDRTQDFVNLGRHATWVKWAVPTAEAIRQACLAQESRVTHSQPYVPPVQITSLHVSNSKFLGPLVIEFNPQYNALVGGRGTGKSTILEYIRWGLSDDPPIDNSVEGDADYRAKRRNLIDKTLVAQNGNVQITFLLNEVPHVVRRNSSTGEILLKIGAAEFVPCKDTDVRSLLPIQSYSQKQLSQVGIKLDELNRFVKQGIRGDLDALSKSFGSLSMEIRAAYSRYLHKMETERRITNSSTELRSLEEQVRHVRSQLRGLDQSDLQTIALQSEYEEGDQFITRVRSAIEQAQQDVNGLTLPLPELADISDTYLSGLPDRTLVETALSELKDILLKSHEHLVMLKNELNRLSSQAAPPLKSVQDWQSAKAAYQTKYEESKARSSAQQATLNQLSTLESRLKAVRMDIGTLSNQLATLGVPETEYSELRSQWKELHLRRAAVLETQCSLLTSLSGGQIKATLQRCADCDEASLKLKSILTGTNVRREKVENLLGSFLGSADPLGEWLSIITELELLSLQPKDSAHSVSPPATPLLSRSGFSQQDIQKLGNKLTTDSWLDLSLVVLEDRPVFEYRAREAEYIPFAEASAGQQATALLWALLSQEGPPLVIDQPEDDLDNQVISKVVEHIWEAKPKRQLIFSSHNANLVVNGDAELVICCDYRIAGDQSTGFIKVQGAIDVPAVREEIARVMEGGRDAFKLRMDKYGF